MDDKNFNAKVLVEYLEMAGDKQPKGNLVSR
jgi:hypothetical protein